MKRIILFTLLTYAVDIHAQIGYQISLLNTATGEPRANETVNVTVNLTNSEGGVIYTGNQSATTNDFGVLSLTIGNQDTFKEVDFTKIPFYIEVSANGVAIGKSQVLSVPVAEYAKRTGTLTKELLVGTWVKECNMHRVVNATYPVYDAKKEADINIPFTYTYYDEVQFCIVFNIDGSAKKSIRDKSWTVGFKGRNGVPNDLSSDIDTTEEYEYIIDGSNVFFIRNKQLGEPSPVFTHVSSPYVIKEQSSMYYISTIGVLGDGYTKQQ